MIDKIISIETEKNGKSIFKIKCRNMPHFNELKWSLLLYNYIFLISHEEQWYTPVIPSIEELNQEDHEFENSLNSIATLPQKQEF